MYRIKFLLNLIKIFLEYIKIIKIYLEYLLLLFGFWKVGFILGVKKVINWLSR